MVSLKGKKVLCILAHPDDEVIFGWPIFQRTDIWKYLLVVSDNGHWKKHGGDPLGALREICFNEGICLYDCLQVYANFYMLPAAKELGNIYKIVRKIETAIEWAIDDIRPDYIFTHSAHGEYGHGTHEALFKIVSRHKKVKNLLFTDICLPTKKYISSDGLPDFNRQIFYKKLVQHCLLDTSFAKRSRRVYEKHFSWTTTLEIPTKCGLYILKDGDKY